MDLRDHQSGCEAPRSKRTQCIIARHDLTALVKQLENKSQSKQRKSKKVQAQSVTLWELRAAFGVEEAELEAKECRAREAAKKKADDTAHTLRIIQEIAGRVFRLPARKRKDDLVALAGVLALPLEGTIVGLVKVIKDHLAENPSQANEPRFSGLYRSRKRTASMARSSKSVEPKLSPS